MKLRCHKNAFTLIELLVVISIIAILAAMILPSLSRGKAQAKKIQCVSQLRQSGIAFSAFAHDHNGLFPMSIASAAGGSLEFTVEAYRLAGEFYFTFRHFQPLSADLVTPKVVVCPTDERIAAESFASLKNENLSYFVGGNASASRPMSILAGDRNITNDWRSPTSMVNLGSESLRWTWEMHRFKGNFLYSDGHVETRNSIGLTANPGETTLAFLPSTKSPRGAEAGPEGNSPSGTDSPSDNGPQKASPQAPSDNPPTDAGSPGNGSGSSIALKEKSRSKLLQDASLVATAKVQTKSVEPVVALTNAEVSASSIPPSTILVATPVLASSAQARTSYGVGFWMLLFILLIIGMLIYLEVRRRLRSSYKEKRSLLAPLLLKSKQKTVSRDDWSDPGISLH